MSDYTIVADVSNAIAGLLRKQMVPDVIPNENRIMVGSPVDNPQAALSIWLYDIKEERGAASGARLNEGLGRQRNPSMYLNLYYMLTPISASDQKFRQIEEQKVLGRTMQVLKDYPVLHPKTYEPIQDNRPDGIRISLQDIPREEKLKIYSFPSAAYKLSAFYTVSGIELPSAIVKDISRVREMDIRYGRKE